MEVNIITRNPDKRFFAESIFSKYGIDVRFIDEDYPEIQADSSLEIARYTAQFVAKELGIPVIREDHSFFIDAYGVPGPYMNHFERTIPASRLLRLLEHEPDRSAHFCVATVYAEPDGKTIECVFEVPVVIEKEIKGDITKGWDTLLRFPDEERTFAQYPLYERNGIWGQNFEKIAQALLAR